LSVAPVQLSEIGIEESMRRAPCVQRTTDPIGTSVDPHDQAPVEADEPSVSSLCAHATATVAKIARKTRREVGGVLMIRQHCTTDTVGLPGR
jgi:hypothetical protein